MTTATQLSSSSCLARVVTLGFLVLVGACGTETRIPTVAATQQSASLDDATPAYDGIIGLTAPTSDFRSGAPDIVKQRGIQTAPGRFADLVPAGGYAVVPASILGVGNCIPFGTNTFFGFTGFIYRNLAPFVLQVGDTLKFDLGSLNNVPTRRNIYMSLTNANPGPTSLSGIDVVPQGIGATGWVQVVTEAQTPQNALGNFVLNDYELKYVATGGFNFPGGGLAIGFAGSPPASFADGNCEQVLVWTSSTDASGKFYSRFFNKGHLQTGPLDQPGGGTGVNIGGFKLASATPPNAAPTIALATTTGSEGSISTGLSVTVTDPDGDLLTVDVDWDNNGTYDDTYTGIIPPTNISPAHQYADNGTYTIKARVSDGNGGSATATATAMVMNVAPSVGAISVSASPVTVGQSVSLSASFTDPGTLDTHTGTISWGDGTSAAVITETDGSGSASGSHAYSAAGIYTVTVTVTDKDGDSGSSTYQYVVVADPSAGFITGGGWIIAGGRVNYGFNAKYQGSTLTCNVTVQLPAGAFTSTSCDWLVVSGNSAWLSGTGTVNGNSTPFLLVVTDGGEPGGGNDRIRIQAGGFDTQVGPLDALPTTATGNGNVQVHKAK